MLFFKNMKKSNIYILVVTNNIDKCILRNNKMAKNEKPTPKLEDLEEMIGLNFKDGDYEPWKKMYQDMADQHEKAKEGVKYGPGMNEDEIVEEFAKYLAKFDDDTDLAKVEKWKQSKYKGKARQIIEQLAKSRKLDYSDYISQLKSEGIQTLLESYRENEKNSNKEHLTQNILGLIDKYKHADSLYEQLEKAKSHIIEGKSAAEVKANIKEYIGAHLNYKHDVSVKENLKN